MSNDDDFDPGTTAAAPTGSDPGLVADRYRILRTLGRGGGGHVWLAEDQKLGRQVALKRVTGETDTEILLTRGMREAQTTARLANEHVVRVYDAFEYEDAPWIVMEYVPGPSLAELLENDRRLPVDQVVTIGAQLATALAAAHRAGILHRDVKPANVLLTDREGRDAKLTDFGIARAEEDHQLTRTGFVSGTAAYFSPELARGEDPSAGSDVWALGATLYAAVEGRRPFRDEANAVAQLHTIVRELPARPRHAGRLTPVLQGMLDPDTATRWDAERAARELSALERGEGTSGPAGWPTPGGAQAAEGRGAGATQQVPRGHHTRAVPVAGAAAGAAAARDGAHVREPRPYPSSARTSQSRGARPAPPPRRRRPVRPGVWLGWILALVLLVAFIWLANEVLKSSGARDGADGPVSTAPEETGGEDGSAAAVSADTARALAEDFYARLQDDGLPAARELTTPDAYIDDAIADGLDSVDVSDLSAEEQGDGTAVVTGTISYTYGSNVLRQAETLTVADVDGEPRIVLRRAQGLD